MKLRRIISCFADVAAIGLFIYLLIFPKAATEPTRSALEFCAITLIPSLFIYMVLSKMIITLPVTEKLIKVMGLSTFSLLTGTLCGCPVGAKNATTLYEQERITKKHAEYLCSFTNNAGVSFVIGFVGSELFGDKSIGIRLFIYQLTASIITAFIMKYLLFGKERLPRMNPCNSSKIGLREAVADSAEAMLNICASAVFFMVAGSVAVNLFSLGQTGEAILRSALEFSSGCAAAAKCGRYSLPITAFAVGQTGLCVALQVKSVLGNRLSIRPFLLGKLISCAIMVFLAVIIG